MNFDRSTEGESPLHWLNVIQRGGTDDWRRLYRRCHERGFARQIFRMLDRPDPDSLPACRLWLRLLEDLHPGMSEMRSDAKGQPVGSSPAVVDGKVIVGSEDGSVDCFGGKKKSNSTMTPEAALESQIQKYAAMTGEQRLALSFEMHELSCELAREQIRDQFPQADAGEVEQRLQQRLKLAYAL